MKKQILTNQRNLITPTIKLILCFLLFADFSTNSYAQKNTTDLNGSLVGTWIVPIQASTSPLAVLDNESIESNNITCYYQYTFQSDGTFKKEVFLFGQLVNISDNSEKLAIKGRWFTQNNQIFLTEKNGTTSLTYVISKERLTLKSNSTEIELLANR
jgi:hypothetical protein